MIRTSRLRPAAALLPLLLASAAGAQTAAPASPTPPAARTPAAPPPVPAPTVPDPRAATPEQRRDGKAVFDKFVEGVGGRSRAATLRDVQSRGQVTAKTPQGEIAMELQTAIVFPDRLSQQIDSPFGHISMVATPQSAFLVGPQGAQDLPAPMKDELMRQIQRVPLFLAGQQDSSGLAVAAVGTEKVGDVTARVLAIRWGATDVVWYVDPRDGRLLRTRHVSSGMDGKPAEVVSDYLDYRPVSGFPVAHRLEVSTNGEKDQTLILEECRINAGVDPKLFTRPPSPTAAPAVPAVTPAAETPKP